MNEASGDAEYADVVERTLYNGALAGVSLAQFGLHFRVPSWCAAVYAQINGQLQPALEVVNGYAVIQRAWQDGDTVQIELAMPIQRVSAHPFVSQLQGRVALQRGPLIYTLRR